ncbi:MAG: N-6 DNA methylase, partial [bacterium]
MDKEKAKQEILELIAKYNKVLEEKRFSRYNEEMTKKDFILPLFRALGWNVENSEEVSAEEKISKGRVDYSFRINRIPKFFLEAKPLKEDLDKPEFIEQAINYAWHKGCTWAVLTDFEHLKIFNAEWKTADPFQSHLKTIPCHEFLDRFSELWLLSKESFEQGLIDKEAEKWGKRTKKIPVDKQLLADFTRFRGLLSKNIMKLNQSMNLTEEDLDESIQRILDRLIFIRNCEDRELEAKTLISNLREWESRGRGQLIKSLREVFVYFDKQYNSKIFITHLCDDLMISDEVLHEIIEGLYYTKDRSLSYDFSAIEADVLGNIYEQYLGHILKKTEKRAKLTANNAHRKEQGIYYTPTYIVDYIVRNTLGELLKDKKVNAEKIRVLDPACGSGSFLIKAFDVLNEYYSKNDKDYNQTQFDFKTGTPFTTKAKILQNNIFGVDLDKQAVEIAQLNLLLKIAERGHRLPLLQENIKVGNSLIDDPAIAEDKAFKWEEEFNQIINEGGFDVVISNPPYVQLSMEADLPEVLKQYILERFKSSMGRLNTFGFFIKLGIDILRDGGRLGFIIPNTVLTQDYYEELREMILQDCKIVSIVSFGDLPFKDAVVENVILVLEKTRSHKKRETNKVKIFSVNANMEFEKQKVIDQAVFN